MDNRSLLHRFPSKIFFNYKLSFHLLFDSSIHTFNPNAPTYFRILLCSLIRILYKSQLLN